MARAEALQRVATLHKIYIDSNEEFSQASEDHLAAGSDLDAAQAVSVTAGNSPPSQHLRSCFLPQSG